MDIHKRSEEEARKLFEDKSAQFIVLDKKIRTDIKGNEELNLVLFDVASESEEGSVLTLNAKDYSENLRTAQAHEIDRAKKLLGNYRKSVWSDEDLNS